MTAQPVVVALDIGGTTIKSALAAADEVLLERAVPTMANAGPAAVLYAVLSAARELTGQARRRGHEVRAVGIAAPGSVDEATGTVINAENVGWVDVPLATIVEEALELPVGFGHDVRAGGLAEWQQGAGVGATDLAFLPVGTGISAALVLDGRLVVGGGYVGEVGHGGWRTRADGLPCPCGGIGCAETFASAAGVARTYSVLSGETVDSAADVLSRRDAGDDTARRVWADAIAELAAIVTDLIRVAGVPLVVVGGGLAQAGEALLSPLRTTVNEQLTVHRTPEIVPAQLGPMAGVRGAALLGWEAAS